MEHTDYHIATGSSNPPEPDDSGILEINTSSLSESIPHFQEPKTTISPAIEKLLHEQVYVQDGIDYCEYKPIGPSNHF